MFEKIKERKNIKILDIGGGSGYFAMAMYEKFYKNNCEIFVIDTTKYNTWEQNSDKIKFIENSANNLKILFESNTFDIIFANRVFHHFIQNTWEKSIEGMFGIMEQITFVLKEDGYFCID
jgi:ubiquinone/menaquinone biosynthesis C-methylase UbiE